MQRSLEREDRNRGRRAAELAIPFFSYGFRPFFFGAALWAVVAMVLWIGTITGLWNLGRGYGALAWHAHEMIFGYTAAVVAGFLLTAVPNWTGRLPVKGWRLILLFVLWCAARVAFLVTGLTGPLPAVALDSLFLPCLLLVIAREVVIGRNWRNLKLLVLVAFLAAADIGFHAEVLISGSANVGSRVGIAAIIGLIMLVGGRIVPSFTHTWLLRMGSEHLPVSFDRVDVMTLLFSTVALTLWVVMPKAEGTGIFFLSAALLQCARLWRWAGLHAWREPLVLILHIGYAFVPLGFLLGAISIFVPHVFVGTEPLHAWTVGAIGLMTLAVMTRATRGHTGRALTASALTILTYAAIIAAAVLRIGAGALPQAYGVLLQLAGIAWIVAFGLFVVEYAPMLLRRRMKYG
jgi:uncharacterized protein involved in response to NO